MSLDFHSGLKRGQGVDTIDSTTRIIREHTKSNGDNLVAGYGIQPKTKECFSLCLHELEYPDPTRIAHILTCNLEGEIIILPPPSTWLCEVTAQSWNLLLNVSIVVPNGAKFLLKLIH